MDNNMENNFEGAPRYSLIIETVKGTKYCYDKDSNCFVYMANNSLESKTTLARLDYLTTMFADKNEFAKHFGIEDDLKGIYIKYVFKGDNFLAPVFNNREWNHIVSKYNGKKFSASDYNTLFTLNSIYYEIIDNNSNFSNLIQNNPNKTVKIDFRLKKLIEQLLAHERAIYSKKQNSYSIKDDIYMKDKTGFYLDFRNVMLKSYRDFRSLYFNYYKYKNKKEEKKQDVCDNTKKKVLIPPQQISMFD